MEIETIPAKNQTPHSLKKLPPKEDFLTDEIYKGLLGGYEKLKQDNFSNMITNKERQRIRNFITKRLEK